MSAVPSVMVSLPVPPVSVSTLATVAELVPLARVSVSLPAPRSMEPLVTAVASVMASSPVPPIRVPTLLTVPVLPLAARVSLLAPAPRSTAMAVVSAVAECDGVGAGAAGDGLDVGDGGGVGEVAEGQRVVAGAEIDGGRDHGGAQRDGVGAGAAGEVSTLVTVAVLVPLARVSVSLPAPRSTEPLATAVPKVTVSAPVPPIRVSMLLTVPVLPTLAERQLVGCRRRDRPTCVGERGCECDGVVAGAAGECLDIGDGG